MFKKKTKVSRGILSIADMAARTRGFILDSQIQHGHEVSAILGCPAISEEGAAHEEQESDSRVERLGHLIPLLYAYSKMLADGTTEYQIQNLSEELSDLPSEVWTQSKKMMEEFAFSALVGTISQLIDMRLIQLPKDKR